LIINDEIKMNLKSTLVDICYD